LGRHSHRFSPSNNGQTQNHASESALERVSCCYWEDRGCTNLESAIHILCACRDILDKGRVDSEHVYGQLGDLRLVLWKHIIVFEILRCCGVHLHDPGHADCRSASWWMNSRIIEVSDTNCWAGSEHDRRHVRTSEA
jgi:hypothetical protein